MKEYHKPEIVAEYCEKDLEDLVVAEARSEEHTSELQSH